MIHIVVDNGIKYSLFSHPVGLHLAQTLSHTWTIGVTNRSPGIPPEELNHLFQRFWRLGGNHSAEVTGLGLSIAYQIAQRHGMNMTLVSEQDGQTTLTFHFKALSFKNISSQ